MIWEGKILIFQKFECFDFINQDKIYPSPLRLCDFGIESRYEEKYDFDNANRRDYEGFLFQYTLSGVGRFIENQEEIHLEAGKAFFVKLPHQSRYYLPKNEKQTWHFFYLHFTGELAKVFYDQIIKQKGNVFSLSRNSETIRLFFDEHSAVKGGKQYRPYESGVFLMQFLTSLQRDIENQGDGAPNACVKQAIQWIHRNYSYQSGLSKMSQDIGITLAHLDRQFLLSQGISPMKYLTNVRLEHAMSLLLNTSLSVQLVANECGFSNGNYFTKVFHKILKVTPSEYRIKYARSHSTDTN